MDDLKSPPGRRLLPVVISVTFVGFLDTHLLIPIMALYAASLGAGVGVAGLIIGLYSIINTPANILFGRLIDRIGFKKPLVIGLIGDALGMFLYTLCRTPWHLGLVRIFHGGAGGLVGPATMSVTADYAGRTGKGKAMGIYGMSMALATLVGYGLGGVIADRLGSKTVFLFGGAVMIIGVALSTLLPVKRQPASETGETSFRRIGQQVKGLFLRPGLTLAYSAIFAQYFTFGGVVILLPFFIKDLGMQEFHVGMMLATFAAVFGLAQFPSGKLSDRVGRLLPIVAGLGLGIISLIILPSMTVFPLLLLVMAVYGLGFGLLFPSVSALIADNTADAERGLATGMFHALLTAGVAVGSPVMGWVGEGLNIKAGLMLSPVFMVPALVITLVSLRRK